MGLNMTGLVGFASLVATLSMCVASIWIDGSPFDINYFGDKNSTNNLLEISSNVTNIGDGNDVRSTECYVSSYASVALFLAGVIAARFGLWMSDLTVTQVLQERVEEERRGLLNGVQVHDYIFLRAGTVD